MEWNIEVHIDYRESFLKEYFEKNDEYQKIVSIKNLEIGDIVILINNTPAILIERKTMKDLASSIQDGRLREQKYRIASSSYPKNKIIYLIEGSLDEKMYGKVNKKALQGSMINTMLRDDYKVYRTKDQKESVYFLVRLISKLQTDKKKLFDEKSETDYCDLVSLSKKSQLTPITFNQVVLLQIQGLSSRYVKEILLIYPTIKDLILKYESLESLNEKENLLSEIQVDTSTGKKRKIGKVISKRIYDHLYPNLQEPQI